MAPTLYAIVLESCKDYLRSYNISFEIAALIYKQSLSADDLRQLLAFNLDRDRLEGELRKFSCISYIDKTQKKTEDTDTLTATFGKAFTHKLNLIREDRNQDYSITVIPLACWPDILFNPMKT
jgi:hypothetical protein